MKCHLLPPVDQIKIPASCSAVSLVCVINTHFNEDTCIVMTHWLHITCTTVTTPRLRSHSYIRRRLPLQRRVKLDDILYKCREARNAEGRRKFHHVGYLTCSSCSTLTSQNLTHSICHQHLSIVQMDIHVHDSSNLFMFLNLMIVLHDN